MDAQQGFGRLALCGQPHIFTLRGVRSRSLFFLGLKLPRPHGGEVPGGAPPLGSGTVTRPWVPSRLPHRCSHAVLQS